MSRHMSTNLVTATFKAAFKTFMELLQKCGVNQSFSATAKLLDNTVTETFFSTFKREEAYHREYTSKQHFRRSVEEYIRFYNEVRPHQTLNFKTPQGFEDNFHSQFTEKQYSNIVLI